MTVEITEEVIDLVKQAAYKVGRRYHGWIDREDLAQEGMAWLLTHPRQVKALVGEGESEESQRAFKRLSYRLMQHMEGVARAAKASNSGYKPEDEFFYSNSVIEMILPALWSEEDAAAAPTREREERMAKADPSEGNNWFAFTADVRTAYQAATREEKLSPEVRMCLSLRYGSGLTVEQIARFYSVSPTAVQNWIDQGLRTLSTKLNGVIPLLCKHGCECGEPERVDLPTEEA